MADNFSQATSDDLEAVRALTEAAYRPITEQIGAPPLAVTTDYAPRIAAGAVWLRREPFGLAGLLALELHADHGMIHSLAVAPAFQGQGHGIALLRHAEQLVLDAGHREIGSAPMRAWSGTLLSTNRSAIGRSGAGPIRDALAG